MKPIVNLILINFFINLEITGLVGSSQSFIFEELQKKLQRRHNFIINRPRRSMISFNKEGYPEPLPLTTLSPLHLRSPHQSLYQGSRRPNDTRVYRRHFEYEAQQSGHHVYLDGNFDCIITYLAMETDGGIPILLRGGAGYNFFVVVVRAKAFNDLKGSVRAYCQRQPDAYYTDKPTVAPFKYF